MAEILFDIDFPDSIKGEVERLVNNAAWLLPLWVQRLYVGWDTSDKDAAAYMHVNKDYRFARLTVCIGLIDCIPERRQETIYHEIIHCYTAPIADYAQQIIDIYVPEESEPKTNEVISNELRRKSEAITQDFAFAIMKKFNEN